MTENATIQNGNHITQNEKQTMKKLPSEIKKEGTDYFGRPVFSDSQGNLYVDVNISDRFGGEPKYCTKYRNEFESEPDIPMPAEWKPKIKCK